jgi:lipoic acid synthetase
MNHPDWLKIKLPVGEEFKKVKSIINAYQINTVCVEARCPNKSECWGNGVFTFMILGDICTRNCRFCSVRSGIPYKVDYDEPVRIANVVKENKSKYVVITSVDRDDLPDGGATIYARAIHLIKNENPDCKVEVLIPDFNGNKTSLDIVFNEKPDILAHNVETVPSLYNKIRQRAKYERSIEVLRIAKNNGLTTKSGMMLGLGERIEEVIEVMQDLRGIGCDILTLGQYLQPTKNQVRVEKYFTPGEFQELKEKAYLLSFKKVESGPLVRSSYHAGI